MIVGIGVDIVEIARINKIALTYGEKFTDRILSEIEKESLPALKETKKINFIAGRFAAKEAFAKAMGIGIGQIAFKDINIISADTTTQDSTTKDRAIKGKPMILITDKITRILKENFGEFNYNIFASISHERNNAIAMVVIEKI
jgi:holo-[acyl-carrier protein] synthase